MKTNILLQQCQLAFDGGMDEMSLWLFLRACKHMQELGATEAEVQNALLSYLESECLSELVSYNEAVETDPVEYAAYQAVISIFNPL